MDQLPFTVYDFFGYLASGLVVLTSIVAAFVGVDPLGETPSLVVGVVLVVAAYTAGHLVANIAGDLLERRIVRKRLGMPTAILMGEPPKSELVRWLFPGYSTALPAGVQARISARAEKAGVTDTGESLFFHCHAVMKSEEPVQIRLNTFLNLYGFCRNMSMALLLSAAALGLGLIIGSAETGPEVGPGWWLIAAVIGAFGLLYRYLKFFRQYGLELLTSYAEKA